ncbi:MAG: hypothetical protein M1827_003998 [Pycnora praestabilis]|nr:MAG: hypothetical protein M1827_003998 [Pycnora praestabilis]
MNPDSAQDVATAVKILSQNANCQFAIRGGGHTPWAGASSIDDGITIDLGNLNNITLSTNGTIAQVGGGAKWVDVYLELDALGLAVPGGRVSSVGVGGLTTGDLFRALKGGSNNFGIVTRFDLKTFQQGKMWGGEVVYPGVLAPQIFANFATFTNAVAYDPYASLITSYSYVGALGMSLINNYMVYTKPEAYPAAFQPFANLSGQILNTMRISNLTDFTEEIAKDEIFATLEHAADATTLTTINNISLSCLETVKNATGLVWSISYEPVPTAITKHANTTGGNSLGLDPSDGNLVLTLLSISWSSPLSTSSINLAAQSWVTQSTAYARDHFQLNPYIYLNYAAPYQDPISGYGLDNKAMLQNVSKRYDPTGVFQTQVPGGFKLFLKTPVPDGVGVQPSSGGVVNVQPSSGGNVTSPP